MINLKKMRLIIRTIHESNRSLVKHRLGSLIPFFLGLILFSLLMVFINSISPLAPFVYSLF